MRNWRYAMAADLARLANKGRPADAGYWYAPDQKDSGKPRLRFRPHGHVHVITRPLVERLPRFTGAWLG